MTLHVTKNASEDKEKEEKQYEDILSCDGSFSRQVTWLCRNTYVYQLFKINGFPLCRGTR